MLKAYMRMLPVLQAQEDLIQAEVVAYGTASMKRADGRRWARERRRMARSMERYSKGPAITDLPPEQAVQRLAALGISIRYVTKTPVEETPT